MADLVSPDQIRNRSFQTTFRGFDRAEVTEFLEKISRTIEFLDRERARISTQSTEQVDGDLQSEFQRVSSEIGELLEAARVAAEGMRDRAAAEAAEWRRSAEEDATGLRKEAQSDAEALRGDAWSTSKQMLDQSQAEARQIHEAAERDALAVVGHSERESHRTLAAAKREAEEQLRNSKMESERLLVEARAKHDGIIETARKQADAAQERARALEVRRDELLAELETVRSRIHAMEADIEERRKPVPPEPGQPASVRLIPAESSGDADTKTAPREWSPTDTIKIIPAEGKKAESDEPVDAALLADEVRRLRDEAAMAERTSNQNEQDEVESPTSEEEPEEEPAGSSDDDPEVPPAEVREPGDDEPAAGSQDKPWALDSLFATLRSEPAQEPRAAAEYPPEPEVEEAVRAEPETQESDDPSPDPGGDDALGERDRLLLPITNRVLRSVKRQLTEAQNITLEDVRVNEKWNPESIDLADRVRGDLVVLVQESFAAGHSAAGAALGADVTRAKPSKSDIPDHSDELSVALADALAAVAESAEEQGPRALSASLSRVYRAWRTDEAERRLREYAMRAFHRGVLAGGVGAGATRIRWVLSGRGCTTCRAAGKAGDVAIDSDFPGIDGVPPVHPGCACAITPV
jgi:DivIVA domain-containing protein